MRTILKKIEETNAAIEETRRHYIKLTDNLNELSVQLCENISFDDVRPMRKEDITVGQRIFGKNDEGFYTLVIEEILGFGDLDFKSFEAEGCRYGIFKHYVLKDQL